MEICLWSAQPRSNTNIMNREEGENMAPNMYTVTVIKAMSIDASTKTNMYTVITAMSIGAN